jgi:hypothetical protein
MKRWSFLVIKSVFFHELLRSVVLLLWLLLLSGAIVGHVVRGTNDVHRPWRVPRVWKANSFRHIGHDQLSAPFSSLAAAPSQPMSSPGGPFEHIDSNGVEFGDTEHSTIGGNWCVLWSARS